MCANAGAGEAHCHRTRMHQTKRQELIGCYDCGGGVSFSAASHPHCGSSQPSGPYLMSEREQKRRRIEEKNDKPLVAVTLLCCALGVAFGVLSPRQDHGRPSWAAWAMGS